MAENPVQMRMRLVSRLFSLEGDDFTYEVLNNHRGNYPTDPPASVCEDLDVQVNELMGCKWYRMKAPNVEFTGVTHKILYVHGGGYCLESGAAQYFFAEYLAQETGAEIWFPEYPLAPEHTCLAALNMVTELYKLMLKETAAKHISFVGDSAGGTIVASCSLMWKDAGIPLPSCGIMICPGLYIGTPEDPDVLAAYKEQAAKDPMFQPQSMPICGQLWRGALPMSDYRGNPIAGNYANVEPMLVFGGKSELIYPLISHGVKKMIIDGAHVRYIEGENRTHCWVMFPGDNEADRKIVIDALNDPTTI